MLKMILAHVLHTSGSGVPVSDAASDTRPPECGGAGVAAATVLPFFDFCEFLVVFSSSSV